MPENEVLDSEATEIAAVPKGHKAETITMTKAERDSLIRERDEARQSERYHWEQLQARRGKSEPEEAEEEEGIDTSDLIPAKGTGSADVDESLYSEPEKWLEAISKGPKAIKALIKKEIEGHVTAEQVIEIASKIADRRINAERGKITSDTSLMTKYPEYSDKKSEFYRIASEEYQELVAQDPSAKKTVSTLFAAGKLAKARMDAAAPKRTVREEDDEHGEYDYERAGEDDRIRRINAQDGTRGGNRLGRGEEAESALGPQARAVLEGMGVKEEAYRASQKSIGASRRKR